MKPEEEALITPVFGVRKAPSCCLISKTILGHIIMLPVNVIGY
jgi:hypothetical protein